MSDSKKKERGLISNALSIVKKLGETGIGALNHVAPDTVSKLTQSPNETNVIQGYAKEKNPFDGKKYENPQQMMREHLPNVTGKLLGKHYKKINNVASFISPDLNDKLSDYLFERLNDFVSELSSVDGLLKEVGLKDFTELTKDPSRSQRISIALANQTKIIAVIQGLFTGAVGGIGAIIDVPTSLALALKSIYQTGRAYGFELKPKDQAVVEYIFKEIDLSTVAEKQALLAAIRTFSSVLETHNVTQLQQLLGSGNDIDAIRKWIANEDGSFKLPWMNHLPQFGLFTKLTPFAAMGISAIYSCKLVDDATNHAQQVFSDAREYLLNHPEEKIDALEAYEKMLQQISEAHLPLLVENTKREELQQPTVESVNEAIVQDEIKTKPIENETKYQDEVYQPDIQSITKKDVQEDKKQVITSENVEPIIEHVSPSKPKNTIQKKDMVEQTTSADIKDEAESKKTVTKKRMTVKRETQVQNSSSQISNKASNKAENDTD